MSFRRLSAESNLPLAPALVVVWLPGTPAFAGAGKPRHDKYVRETPALHARLDPALARPPELCYLAPAIRAAQQGLRRRP
jgi:hypothetical protein